jgi:hypothetical protein
MSKTGHAFTHLSENGHFKGINEDEGIILKRILYKLTVIMEGDRTGSLSCQTAGCAMSTLEPSASVALVT